MVDRALLDTSTTTWADLFGNGKRYVVPRFQRDYAWGEDEWTDLWSDICALRDDSHYMGTVVVKPDGDRRWEVIDGQQRMATLSILAMAIIAEIRSLAERGIDVDDNVGRAELLRDRFISTKHVGSLREESRLKLNDSDDDFYQGYLVHPRQVAHPSRLTPSTKRLWDALGFFRERIRARFGETSTGYQLATFLGESVATSLLFIQIKVQNEVSAYTVFETLNARGMELTTTDLLKNYLFSLVSAADLDLQQAQSHWRRVVGRVTAQRFTDFLYHYVVSLGVEDVKKDRLFSRVRALINSRDEVFPWLERLEDAADLYVALSDPGDEMWQSEPEARRYVRELALFRVDQFKPLILAADRIRKSKLDRTKLLKICSNLSMRATIVGRRNTADILRAYQAAIREVVEERAHTIKAIFAWLRALYSADEEFEKQFETLQIDTNGPRKKLAKYILSALEPSYGGPELDYETSNTTLEHILPENPGDAWGDVSHDDRLRFTYRLGNLTLLEPALNREAGTAGYSTKRAIFARSSIKMTSAIDSAEWNGSAIVARQTDLAGRAAQRWRIDYD